MGFRWRDSTLGVVTCECSWRRSSPVTRVSRSPLRLGLENEAPEEEAGDISLPNVDSKQIPCTVQYIVGVTPIKCFVFHRPHNPFLELKTEKAPKTARISLIQNTLKRYEFNLRHKGAFINKCINCEWALFWILDLLVFKLSCEFLFMFQLNKMNNLIPNQGFVLPKTHVFHRRGDGSETLYDVCDPLCRRTRFRSPDEENVNASGELRSLIGD